MPGDGGYFYRQQQATRDAQLAAEQAAAKKAADAEAYAAATAARVLTPEQRQANIARDLALSQIRGARPSGQEAQFYQPAYQPQYQNYNMGNPMSISQYGQQPQMNWQTGQPTQSGNTLTPELARTLMQRSMTSSGVPTSEFQRFGGYDAVKSLYDKSGGDYSGQGNPYPQQQFNPYTNQYQTPFSYQQFAQQMQTPFSYQQPMQQMQTPFSYPSMQQPAAQPNLGPSQAIVGRSSQMRGTPSVMRRAEGGIASLLKKDK